MRIDAEQIECPALQPSGLGGDRDGGLLLGRQPESVEHQARQIRQQHRETVRRKALRGPLGEGFLPTAFGNLSRCDRSVALGPRRGRVIVFEQHRASRWRMCHST